MNSPSDNNFAAAGSGLGALSFTTTVLNVSFHAANSVVKGIFANPNQFTGGEGLVIGEEMQFDLTLTTPFTLRPDHVFFRSEVNRGSAGDFLWLSAPKPIVSPGTRLMPDLQTWRRTEGAGAHAPDWSRIDTDITEQGRFNATFSLKGITVPEPSTWVMISSGSAALVSLRTRAAASWA